MKSLRNFRKPGSKINKKSCVCVVYIRQIFANPKLCVLFIENIPTTDVQSIQHRLERCWCIRYHPNPIANITKKKPTETEKCIQQFSVEYRQFYGMDYYPRQINIMFRQIITSFVLYNTNEVVVRGVFFFNFLSFASVLLPLWDRFLHLIKCISPTVKVFLYTHFI